MKRYSELNPLDKLNELRYQNRKKVKGTSPKSPRFLDHSDNEDEDEDKDDHFNKGKNLLVEDSLEDPRPRETKKKRKAFYEDEDELTDGNADECYLCEDGGNVICCDNCFRSFHSSCLKLHSHPDNNWMCPYCKSLQENAYERCANCTQSLKETENYQRLSCSKCLRRIHWDCIDTPLNLIVDAPINKNFVFSPKIVNELKQGFLKRSEYPKEMIKDLYIQHNFEYLFHICNTCIMNTGIQKIKKNTKQQVAETKRDYYLAKLKRSSDIHAFWLNYFKVETTSPMLLKMFLRKLANENVEEEVEIEDLSGDDEGLVSVTESYRIEKVLAIKKPIVSAKKDPADILEEIVKKPVKKKTPLSNYKFLVKWEDMEYSNVTWEDEFIVTKFKEKIKQYFSIRLKMHELTKQPRKENLPRFVDFDKQPAFIKDSLYDYQLKGFKWLVNQYLQKKNAILADEMGLGKTIQTLCFFRYLSVEFGYNGPFLVVAPNSTIYNWQREAQKWCPEYDVVIYVGSAASRKKIMDLEFVSGKNAHSRTNLKPKFQLLITTYMAVNSDVTNLRKVNWEVVVVDEAQRLKNKESKLYSLCDTLRTRFKLLLTGTPIQNSIEELVNLFKYLIPKDSSIVKEIDDLTMKLTIKPTTDPQTGKKVEINETDKKQALRRLRGILKEHMLRRTVQDANLNFPELEEKLVKLDLSSVQKHLYKNILLRNYEVLASTEFSLSRQSGKPKKPTEGLRVSLINILMHLRLVCDHPDLFYSRRRDYDEERKEYEEEVIKSSNKLRLLDKMIPKLLNEGHKLLIFSQFVLMLDILEEFLIFRNLEFERLDGNTRNIDRQRIIDNFNNGKSKIFLLSTRAGGLGINLTSSDTIIFTDSDFNPYRDIQAFCRAYRIGQKNKVMVYRLISKYTVEEKIVENATKKLMMGEMIMNPIDQSKSDKSVLESILRYGTKELFDNIDEKDAEDITDEKLDDLLKREAKPGEGSMKPKTNDLNDYYLSGFNFIDFNFTPILQNSSAVEETKENKYWETLLGNDYAEYEKQNTEALGKGKRLRNKTNNQNDSGVTSDSEDSIDIEIPIEMSSSLDNSIMLNSDSEYDISDLERRKKNRFMLSSEEEEEQEERDRVLHSIIALPEPLKEYLNCLADVYDEIKDKTTEELMKLCGLDEGFRAKMVEFILKFGVFTSLNETMAQLRDYIAPFKNEISMPEYRALKEYLRYFYACLLVEFPSQAICKFFFSISHPYAVRKRILGFVYMRSKLSYYRGKIDKFKIKSKEYRKLFDKKHPLSHGFNTNSWTNADDFCLCDGINRYGMDAWPKIAQDIRLWDHSEPKTWTPDQVWKLIFRKIEGREVQPDEETQALE